MSSDSHPHDPSPAAAEPDPPVTEFQLLEMAIRELLIDEEIITAAEVNDQIDAQDSRNPMLGAKVVARAWSDPGFKRRLLDDAHAALAEMGIEVGTLAELAVVENVSERHNVIVCTLCSCYPRMVLGIPPAWYKSAAYRSRVVADPRGVLREFGTEIADDVAIRVFDSTADKRYLVVPMRPEGTEDWSEVALAELVTRDSMIGVSLAKTPAEVPQAGGA